MPDYAKKLRMAVKTMRDQVTKSKALDDITNAIVGSTETGKVKEAVITMMMMRLLHLVLYKYL
ncbi:10838_t:CDS:2 [Funneliformis geosporum]|uniref:12360_t:CDS:1 n=1 Tax=Funneliformis geosporum TaxID=1117311 RepID=A0A9W4SD97_9GLOM|nr:10838_t:CDS:2 [Funneliformis geosporum]CAI2164385.1 12360_t:CDS:2 [Funneliformis geosporum]